MKQSELKIGEVYRTTGGYAGQEVIVLDTGWVPNKSWSDKTIGRKATKGEPGTHVAVACRNGTDSWIPGVVAAFKIVGLKDEIDAQRAEREKVAARDAREKAAAAKRSNERTELNRGALMRLLGESSIHSITAHYTPGYAYTGVELTNAQVEKLLALLEGSK